MSAEEPTDAEHIKWLDDEIQWLEHILDDREAEVEKLNKLNGRLALQCAAETEEVWRLRDGLRGVIDALDATVMHQARQGGKATLANVVNQARALLDDDH